MTAITPTVGRVVWFYPGDEDLTEMIKRDNQPMKADIVYVWNDGLVNLSVIDHGGEPFAAELVMLVQEGEQAPEGESYCAWMPFQRGQVAKQDAANGAQPDAKREEIYLRRWCVEMAIGRNVGDTESTISVAQTLYNWVTKA